MREQLCGWSAQGLHAVPRGLIQMPRRAMTLRPSAKMRRVRRTSLLRSRASRIHCPARHTGFQPECIESRAQTDPRSVRGLSASPLDRQTELAKKLYAACVSKGSKSPATRLRVTG